MPSQPFSQSPHLRLLVTNRISFLFQILLVHALGVLFEVVTSRGLVILCPFPILESETHCEIFREMLDGYSVRFMATFHSPQTFPMSVCRLGLRRQRCQISGPGPRPICAAVA